MTKVKLIQLRAVCEAIDIAYDKILDEKENATSIEERVDYDLRLKRAFDARWTAKKAYDEALVEFIAADEVP